jgi:predicted phage-related endonuclease
MSAATQILPADVDRAMWLYRRRQLVCSSDIAAIIGVSGYGGPYTIWADKTGRAAHKPTTLAQARGIDMEGPVIGHWCRWYATDGLRVRRAGLMRSNRYKRAGATVDRRSRCDRGRCITEAKTQADAQTNVLGWGSDISPEIPTGIQIQGQWQCHVLGVDHIHYIVSGPNFVPFERIQNADPDLGESLFLAAARFWGRHVIADVMPAAESKDSDLIKAMWPEPARGATYSLDADDCELMHEMLTQRKSAAAATTARDNAAAALQARIGDATEIAWPDGTLAATWRPTKTIDGADHAWQIEHPDAVTRYGRERIERWIDLDKMIADNHGRLPDGLRYRRQFLPKDIT